jgi:hypothetical protein
VNVASSKLVVAVGLEQLELLRRDLDRAGERGKVEALAPRAACLQQGAGTRRTGAAGDGLIIEGPAKIRTTLRAIPGKRLRSWVPKSCTPLRLPRRFSMRAASHSVCAFDTSWTLLTRRT